MSRTVAPSIGWIKHDFLIPKIMTILIVVVVDWRQRSSRKCLKLYKIARLFINPYKQISL